MDLSKSSKREIEEGERNGWREGLGKTALFLMKNKDIYIYI